MNATTIIVFIIIISCLVYLYRFISSIDMTDDDTLELEANESAKHVDYDEN